MDRDTETRAIALLQRALPPETRLDEVQSGPGGTLVRVVGERLPTSSLLLVRDPENGSAPPDALPVAVLEAGDPTERERYRRDGRSFIDLRGAVHIRSPTLYLDRDHLTPPSPPSLPRNRLDPYSDGASRVARALLGAPCDQEWSVRELARRAGVHPSTASRVVRELRSRDLVQDERPGERRRSRITLPDPERLIEDWTRSYRWEDNEVLRLAAPVGSPTRFLKRLGKVFGGHRWALTGPAGASLRAAHTTFDTVHVYLDPDIGPDLFARDQGWSPSPSGRLCLASPRYRESVWPTIDNEQDLPVVSPLQLVLDLWYYPVRGREQARHIIDHLLRPVWEAPDGEG